MANFFARYWKTLAITSVSLTSSYFISHYDYSRINNRLLSAITVQAAEYERRHAGKSLLKHRLLDRNKDIGDDDDDEEDEENDEHESDKNDENITSIREKRFRDFASVEYNGEIYMTPADFLESIIVERPRPRIGRRELTDEMVETMLYKTPPKHQGSKKFFRHLEDSGLISYTEYLFLWVILTKPATQLEIAFAMFDTDGKRFLKILNNNPSDLGNQLVDKHEFLVLGKVMSDKRMSHRQSTKRSSSKSSLNIKKYFSVDEFKQIDTTLTLHFFGKKGRDSLNYTEFKRFMEDFQTEILEIEFMEFSHGFKTISDLDFAEILLRYADFDRDTKKSILKKVKKSSNDPNSITFEQFQNFFSFLNNLDEFNIAMRFHQLSNKPISQAEFQRAVRISTGCELEPHIISLVFRIFDADDDQHLSYDEFMAVMKDRLSRGFQNYDYSETSGSKFDQFKRCFRERAKHDSIISFD